MATITFTLDVNGTVMSYAKQIPNAAVARLATAYKAKYSNPGDRPRIPGAPAPNQPMTNAEVWNAIGAELLRSITKTIHAYESKQAVDTATAATQEIVPT